MGKSRFRNFRLMPNSWFYKLRENVSRRATPTLSCLEDSNPGKAIEPIERTISLPRSNYYHKFAASSNGRGFESPEGPKQKEEKIPLDKRQPGRKIKARVLHSKGNNVKPRVSTLIETQVSAGCSCRVAVDPKKSKKNRGLKKTLEIVEMEKLERPRRSADLLTRTRNKELIEKKSKEYSDAAAVSFDGAMKEERGFESVRETASKSGDHKTNCQARRCSAFCCSCGLGFSESVNESDASLWDVDLWSEEEEEVQAPFLHNSGSDSDPLVLDMKLNFSQADLKETAATLFRRGDAASYSQMQAKLSQMIHEKGSKKKVNRKSDDSRPRRIEHLSENGKSFTSSKEFYAIEATNGPEITSEDRKLFSEAKDRFRDIEISDVKRQTCASKENYKGCAKIDRGGTSPRSYGRRTERKYAQTSQAAVNCASDSQRKISESFAIVKCSFDPHSDFRESMVEMIVENDVRDRQGLQELLDCYISLNSEEYHDIILQVFEQVRSDLFGEDIDKSKAV